MREVSLDAPFTLGQEGSAYCSTETRSAQIAGGILRKWRATVMVWGDVKPPSSFALLCLSLYQPCLGDVRTVRIILILTEMLSMGLLPSRVAFWTSD